MPTCNHDQQPCPTHDPPVDARVPAGLEMHLTLSNAVIYNIDLISA